MLFMRELAPEGSSEPEPGFVVQSPKTLAFLCFGAAVYLGGLCEN